LEEEKKAATVSRRRAGQLRTPMPVTAPKPTTLPAVKPKKKVRPRAKLLTRQRPKVRPSTRFATPKAGLGAGFPIPPGEDDKARTFRTKDKDVIGKRKKKPLADWIGATKVEFEYEKATTPKGVTKDPVTGTLKPVEEKKLDFGGQDLL